MCQINLHGGLLGHQITLGGLLQLFGFWECTFQHPKHRPHWWYWRIMLLTCILQLVFSQKQAVINWSFTPLFYAAATASDIANWWPRYSNSQKKRLFCSSREYASYNAVRRKGNYRESRSCRSRIKENLKVAQRIPVRKLVVPDISISGQDWVFGTEDINYSTSPIEDDYSRNWSLHWRATTIAICLSYSSSGKGHKYGDESFRTSLQQSRNQELRNKLQARTLIPEFKSKKDYHLVSFFNIEHCVLLCSC